MLPTWQEENPSRPALTEEARQANPPILRPLVAEHPRTGLRSLYVPSVHIDRVVHLHQRPDATTAGETPDVSLRDKTDVADGREIIEELLEHTTSAEFCYAHAWQRGDCVIWDNRCTLHAPSAFDDKKEKRLMWRCVHAWSAMRTSARSLLQQPDFLSPLHVSRHTAYLIRITIEGGPEEQLRPTPNELLGRL